MVFSKPFVNKTPFYYTILCNKMGTEPAKWKEIQRITVTVVIRWISKRSGRESTPVCVPMTYSFFVNVQTSSAMYLSMSMPGVFSLMSSMRAWLRVVILVTAENSIFFVCFSFQSSLLLSRTFILVF